jgi:hypothetical protein
MPSLLARLLALKVLLAGVAVASLGGVSLAAATGSLPGPAQNAAHQLVGAPAAHSDADSDSDTADQGAKDEADASARPEATPSPSLVGLCRAYGAGVASANGKALDNPAFTVLITAAGGKDGVSAFCTTLLATAPGGKPTARPTQAQGHPPTAHPSHAPRPHATGASKDQRSTPAPHPTKRP